MKRDGAVSLRCDIGNRHYVQESQYQIGFINAAGRDLVAQDAAKHTIRHDPDSTSGPRVDACGVPSHERRIAWLPSTSNQASAREESRLAIDLAIRGRVRFPTGTLDSCCDRQAAGVYSFTHTTRGSSGTVCWKAPTCPITEDSGWARRERA